MHSRRLYALLLLWATGTSNAAPTYLNCTLTFNGKPTGNIEVTADEANQQVTYVIVESGHSKRLPGVFTADKVRFVSNPGDVAEGQYEIDRTTLSISRATPKLDALMKKSGNENGTCVVVEATKRKF